MGFSCGPVDLVPRDARLIREYVAHEPLVDGMLRRLLIELGGIVLVAHVVADADELLAVVVAAQQDHLGSGGAGGSNEGVD